MQRERARGGDTRRVREAARPDGAGERQPYFGDVAVVVWVVALIGIAVLAGAVMLLALITATVPVSPRVAGPAFDGATPTVSDENEAVVVNDDWVYGPNVTR